MREVIITIYERIQCEHKKLEEQIDYLKSEIDKLPKGKLICKRDGKYHKWYHKENHLKTYISKKNHQFIQKLATKEYLICLYEDLLNEYQALGLYLDKHVNETKKAARLLENKPMYQDYISPYLNPVNTELADWMNQPYKKNNKHPEYLIHKTISGDLVRSKSESIISMLLHKNKIPFRYECELLLGDVLLYPDFTIRHPKSGEYYYWEHFGMMDNNHFKKAFSKLELYASNNIFPSINLITTYETKNNPLNLEMVEGIIKYYFL